MTWTPGPWRCDRPQPDDPHTDVVASDGYVVASCAAYETPSRDFTRKPHEANASLIAAAPEMAEMLEEMMWANVSHYGPDFSGANDLREANYKARALLVRIRGDA